MTAARDVLSALTDLINAAGAVTRSTDWTAYGMVRTPVGAPATPSGPTSLVSYAGLPTGGPGGTYPARDRFHTPATGRWTSTDPATTGPGSGTDPTAEPGAGAGPGAGYDSPYTYAADRPTAYTDPLGDSVCEHLSGVCGSPTFAWNEVIGAAKAAQGIAGSALHPLRTHRQAVDTCDAGFDRWSGATGATWTGLAQCLDDLNPVAGIRRDLHTSLTNPCTDQSGQAFGSALLNTGLTATTLKTGTAAALKTRTPTTGAASRGSDLVNLASGARTNHILQGDATGGGHLWPGLPGKTPFPESWSAARVLHEISDLATDPAAWTNRTVQGSRTLLTGTRNGVEITVIVRSDTGEIITGFPTNLSRNS